MGPAACLVGRTFGGGGSVYLCKTGNEKDCG